MRPPFRDRRHAGDLLAGELTRLEYGSRPARLPLLVLALPRGGVPVGFEIASELHAPLDVFVVRKLGVPSHPELAMGALASGGTKVLNETVVRRLGIPPDVVEIVAEAEKKELLRRESQYRGGLDPLQPQGAAVILVDDGLATGASMRAAVEALRKLDPAEITVAVPIAPSQTVRSLRQQADTVVCTIAAESFGSVGQWYEDFSQTTDEEVRDLLAQASRWAHDPR